MTTTHSSETITLNGKFPIPTKDKTIPKDDKPGQTIHLILEATDTGTLALTRYQRVVVTVREK